MTLLDLFSGIGGFSLGLERAGFRTVAFCEIDEFARRVLAHHWPGVPIYDDVRQLDAARLRADGVWPIDAICGGFPCQDISLAGSGAGLDGTRSGLWREVARLVGELRPRVAIVENVGALRARGLAQVLADLAAVGYESQWHAVPAAAVGAPHLRDRIWIVAVAAHADSAGFASRGGAALHGRGPARPEPARRCGAGADTDTDSAGRGRQRQSQHDDEPGALGHQPDGLGATGWRHGPSAADAVGQRRAQCGGLQRRLARALAAAAAPWPWPAEPPFCRLDDGLPARLARPRLKALGNAVVPPLVELLGRAVLEELHA